MVVFINKTEINNNIKKYKKYSRSLNLRLEDIYKSSLQKN